MEDRAEPAEEYPAALQSQLPRLVSLAEEINQPLTSISNYCETARLLLAALPQNDQVKAAAASLEAAIGQVFQAGDKVRRLGEFVRQGDTSDQRNDEA